MGPSPPGWKRWSVAVTVLRPFNGAIAFQRWKPELHKLWFSFCSFNGASPFSDRSRGPETFNGAIAFQRWKQPALPPQLAIPEPLQWGHRLSAMETPDQQPWRLGQHRSFNGATAFQRWKLGMDFRTFPVQLPSMGPLPMGPLPFSDGNLAWTSGPFQSSFLQWGHCLSAMETALCGSPPSWIHEKRSFPQESVTG